MEEPIRSHRIHRIIQGKVEILDQPVIAESQLTLSVNGREWLDFLCTPTLLKEMCLGFLFTNDVITSTDEIAQIELVHCDRLADVWLIHPAEKPEIWQRNSGCAGGVSDPNVSLKPLPDTAKFSLSQQDLTTILNTLFGRQSLYHQSGGVHTSALFDGTTIIFIAEDIGRHNTLDKLAGMLLMNPGMYQHRSIVTTGRISLEMMQKAARLQASWVISHTSPTTASIELAEQLGIGVIGYARKESCVVYTRPDYFKV